MPFDGYSHEAVYRERRERAAALWQAVPHFDVRSWRTCALTHLASHRVDGWRMANGYPRTRSAGCSFQHAAEYFGITFREAYGLFAGPGAFGDARQWSAREVSYRLIAMSVTIPQPADVARALLAAPYVAFYVALVAA